MPGVTGKFDLGEQNKAGQRLTEFCQENTLVIGNTLFHKHKSQLYTWTSPNGQYRNKIGYILCSQRWKTCIQSAKTRPGADCGSDNQLLIAKFRLQFSSVTQSCPTLCDPMDCSTWGLTIHHKLPEFTQIHVHELVMPSSHLILCCSLLLPSSIFPSIRVFSNESALHISGQSIGVSASTSVLLKNTQDWSLLGLAGFIS